MPGESYEATGRRKTSVARVYLRPGSGNIMMNGRAVNDYLRRGALEMILVQPLDLTETRDQFDIHISTRGGGLRGQAGAACLGIARALIKFNPEMHATLKKAGFLTRDAREKERKKYGLAGARKRFQFSKRQTICCKFARLRICAEVCPQVLPAGILLIGDEDGGTT